MLRSVIIIWGHPSEIAKSLKNYLDAGNPVIVHVNRVYEGAYVDHFIVAKGYDDTFLCFNDPGRSNGRNVKYNYSYFENTIWNSDRRLLVVNNNSTPETPTPTSSNPGPRQVILFEHENYGGNYKVLEIGTYSNPAQMGFSNDSLTSIKVGSEVKVTLGEHDNFNGKTQEFTSNVSSLVGTYIGNQVSGKVTLNTNQ